MIRIELPRDPAEHIALAYSPLLECVLSLHVLVGPNHHALHHHWVREMRALDSELRRSVNAFAFLYKRTLPDFLVPGPHDQPGDFEQELAKLNELEPEVLLEELGRPLYDHGGRRGEGLYGEPRVREVMLQRAKADGDAAVTMAALLIADPGEFAQRLSALLRNYWESTFAAEWERLEPLLAETVAEAGRLLATVGVWPLLGRLPPRCRVDPERRELRIESPHEHHVLVSSENPLVASPSAFVWPHVLVNCDPPWPTSLVYPAPFLTREAAPRVPPTELLRILRALADDTRLRVLKLIAERPRTTQELAPLVGLSMTGLSKSLRRLAEAGIVTAERDGYYVVYRLAPERVTMLSAALAQFLDERDDVNN
jgi:DNA-binding transcriptional ArsR family regulator